MTTKHMHPVHNPVPAPGSNSFGGMLAFLAFGGLVGTYCGYERDPAKPQEGEVGPSASVRQGLSVVLTDCSKPTSAVSELKTAIQMANAAGAGPHTITLASSCAYTLTAAANYWYSANGLPPITTALTIAGQGKSVIERASAAGTPRFRLFYVNGVPTTQVLAGEGALTLQNVILRNGLAVGGKGGPGAGGGAAWAETADLASRGGVAGAGCRAAARTTHRPWGPAAGMGPWEAKVAGAVPTSWAGRAASRRGAKPAAMPAVPSRARGGAYGVWGEPASQRAVVRVVQPAMAVGGGAAAAWAWEPACFC